MHFHFLLQSSQKFSRLPSSLAMNKNAFPFSSSVLTKIFSSSFVVGDEQKMHFHFLLQSSQKFSRLPSSLAMNKKCISIFFFSHHKKFLVFLRRWRGTKNAFPFSSSFITKIFSSSFVVGDEQKMHFHFLLQSSQKFSRLPSSLARNKKCISIFFFTPHENFLVFLRRWR